MNINLKTERLFLRPLTLSDAKEFFAYRSDAETNKYQGWIPQTLDDVEAFMAKTAKQINLPDTWFQCAVIEKKSQKLVGDIGLHFIGPENKQLELGCTLDKNHQNQGYATEALARIIDFAFIDLNKHRIMASIDPNNLPSIHLVERLGFRKEAHFVKSLYIKGCWTDDLIYALLYNDWEKLSSQ
ncbi:MAG: GNAT family N-acetyltransferase [Bacteroidetes bacterium HGW-Bacteroidetes-4]|nr:MAG: GNAT family N-acetyltransferase [Bacteroidetes bacterium HGW-Bacteroidetes-4]